MEIAESGLASGSITYGGSWPSYFTSLSLSFLLYSGDNHIVVRVVVQIRDIRGTYSTWHKMNCDDDGIYIFLNS